MPLPSFDTLIADLTQAFPHQPPSPATVRVYMRELADVPLPVLAEAVRQLIRTRERFPPLALVLSTCAELALNLPGEAGALAQIEARCNWARLDEETRGTPPAVHPLVKEAAERVGGFYAFRSTDEPTFLRGQFRRIYEELRSGSIREAQTGSPAALSVARPLRALPGGA